MCRQRPPPARRRARRQPPARAVTPRRHARPLHLGIVCQHPMSLRLVLQVDIHITIVHVPVAHIAIRQIRRLHWGIIIRIILQTMMRRVLRMARRRENVVDVAQRIRGQMKAPRLAMISNTMMDSQQRVPRSAGMTMKRVPAATTRRIERSPLRAIRRAQPQRVRHHRRVLNAARYWWRLSATKRYHTSVRILLVRRKAGSHTKRAKTAIIRRMKSFRRSATALRTTFRTTMQRVPRTERRPQSAIAAKSPIRERTRAPHSAMIGPKSG